jgi:lipid-A-disaccharide synthase
MKIYLIAGEPSGDKLGAALMEGLISERSDIEFHGVGGPLMQAQGLTSLFDMSELSVMGLAEVLPRLRGLLKRRDETAADILAHAPDALVTIDSPDFCLRVARKVKAAQPIPTIHYVAPTVWAWRPNRAQKMQGVIDHVLALFPFEPPFMHKAGLSCDFVGHPVAAEPIATMAERRAFRQRYSLGDAPVILALPGSRRGEVTRLADVFGATLQKVIAETPDARILIPTASGVEQLVRQQTQNWPGDPLILPPDLPLDQKRAGFAAADLALAASGTVSLELAAANTPMVIAYDMNWLSRQMIKRMLLVDTVTLVNLVSETRAVPEFLGDACKPDDIAKALLNLLDDPAQRAAQLEACKTTMSRLGQGDLVPGLRAAQSVLNFIA